MDKYPAKMSSYVRIKRSIINEMNAKEEALRQKMMVDAVPKLAYMKMMKDIVDSIPSSSDEAKNETIEFFSTKIEELEVDVRGEPRYSYKLHYPIDVGFKANGIKPSFSEKEFTNTKDIIEFVNQLVMSDDTQFVKDTYVIPSPYDLDLMLSTNSKSKHIRFDINVKNDDDDDDDEYDEVPVFDVNRTRVNY